MKYVVKHRSEKLFVTGKDAIIVPVNYTPYTVEAKFIDAEAVKLPGCNPLSNDTVTAVIVTLPADTKTGAVIYGIHVSWSATGTREIEWRSTELTS